MGGVIPSPIHFNRRRTMRALPAVVVARVRRWWAFDARDSAQIFVDGAEVMIRHVFINRPWHYLQKVSVERKGNAARVKDSLWTGRMEVIHVYASPNDLNKL